MTNVSFGDGDGDGDGDGVVMMAMAMAMEMVRLCRDLSALCSSRARSSCRGNDDSRDVVSLCD